MVDDAAAWADWPIGPACFLQQRQACRGIAEPLLQCGKRQRVFAGLRGKSTKTMSVRAGSASPVSASVLNACRGSSADSFVAFPSRKRYDDSRLIGSPVPVSFSVVNSRLFSTIQKPLRSRLPSLAHCTSHQPRRASALSLAKLAVASGKTKVRCRFSRFEGRLVTASANACMFWVAIGRGTFSIGG